MLTVDHLGLILIGQQRHQLSPQTALGLGIPWLALRRRCKKEAALVAEMVVVGSGVGCEYEKNSRTVFRFALTHYNKAVYTAYVAQANRPKKITGCGLTDRPTDTRPYRIASTKNPVTLLRRVSQEHAEK